MFLSRAMSKIGSLEIKYPPTESTYVAPSPSKHHRPLPPIPTRQVRPVLPRMPTFESGQHTASVCTTVNESAEEEDDCEVIDIFEMLSSDPSSTGSATDSRSMSDHGRYVDLGGSSMGIGSHSWSTPTAASCDGGHGDRHINPGQITAQCEHSPLEIFSPRLPPEPLLLGLAESRPISPFSLPPLQIDMTSPYPPLGTSFLYMSTSGSGDQASISDFGSFIGPSPVVTSLSTARSTSSTSSRFLNIDERDLEAESKVSMSLVLSRGLSRTSEVSAGLPVPCPLQVPDIVDIFGSNGADDIGGSVAGMRCAKTPVGSTGVMKEKPMWSDPFGHVLAPIDVLPEIALPEPLCAESSELPEPPHKLLPRASIATETMYSPEVGAWWKTCDAGSECGRRRSVMDIQSVLQRDCEV